MLRIENVANRLESYVLSLSQKRGEKNTELQKMILKITQSDDFRHQWETIPQKTLENTPSVAMPIENPRIKQSPQIRPAIFTLCGVDGSQIYSDRNFNVDFFVINIGTVVFQMGTVEPASLDSIPSFFFEEEINDRFIKNIFDAQSENIASKINSYRTIKEIETLYDCTRNSLVPNRPSLSLMDGTLIAWSMKNDEQSVKRYASAVEHFYSQKYPLASYISYPATQDCMNAFSLLTKDSSFGRIMDREFWKAYLKEGERSAVFASRSTDTLKYYSDECKIYFCYVNMGNEIARIEFPKWVFDEGYLPMVHSILLDESRKGKGYPRILSETHESAVITHDEQKQLFRLIERHCIKMSVPFEKSAKLYSKEHVTI